MEQVDAAVPQRVTLAGDLAGVVLAAGAGTRLRPLTLLRPKALCPVGNVTLLDRALDRLWPVVDSVAVNVSHGRDQLERHLAGRDVHVSIEHPSPLETAGALGKLRSWIAGRDVLVLNADVYHPQDLSLLVDGWDHQRVRLLGVADVARADFDGYRYCGAALLPWAVVGGLPAERHGLYRAVLAPHHSAGRLDLVASDVPYFDCGAHAEYLDANLAASGGVSVIGDGAVVDGEVVRSVIWPGAHVAAHERLSEAIRASDRV
ncbi:MAG TPA: NTP transferase domain-containing protein, partial [Nitriliruptorales bacterium]|nr:NTP transferase domain-containing protein [Nitriliruptorales bacterium]